MDATRIIYWNISQTWVMYTLLIPTVAIFAYGFYNKYRVWSGLGKPVQRFDQPWKRLVRMITLLATHRNFTRFEIASRMHAAIFWSMLLLFLGTVVVAIHADLRIPIMQGWFYLIFQKLVLNVAGLFLLVGCSIALIRRFVLKMNRLQENRDGATPNPADGPMVGMLLLLVAQGFALQAIRLAAAPDPYAVWSPVGYVLSLGLLSVDQAVLVGTYQFTWWFHLVTTFGWIAWLPFSKMAHIFTSAASIYTANLAPPSTDTMEAIDFETTERLGISAIGDLTWKDLLDLEACTACGRCQAVCPAYAGGQPLSPKNLILDLRDYVRTHSESLLSGRVQADELPPMVGGAIKEETLWACTTCRACMEACPVDIEHVPKIVGMRRHLVMEQAEMPDTLADALRSLEDRVHPYKGTSASRTDWCEGLDVPMAADVGEVEVLYWVGCTAAFDPRNQKVARAFVTLLKEAGVSYAILGKEECCTGDPARRMGNEFLYETIARGNIDTLLRYNPKKIVTACPHCFNIIGQEYHQLGGEFEVVHHTRFLAELIDQGRLKVGAKGKESITFHDPCYLGRYNGQYEAPRTLVDSAGERLEMAKSGSNSFCCGAGGGHAWMEEHGSGPRVNQLRAKQAVGTGAGTIAVSCPFCMQMMEDGLKSVADEDGPQVRDVAELLLQVVEGTGSDTVSKVKAEN